MFVGHGLLAFALAGLLARRLGRTRAVALQVAALAALFATLPDVDVVYGLAGPLSALSGSGSPVEAFWDAGNVVHRGATHSLVVGAVAAAAAWAFARDGRSFDLVGGALLSVVVIVATAVGGTLPGLVTALFALGAFGLALAAERRGLSPAAVGGAALLGLWTHPFGDLFTGSPPAFLYPLDVTLVAERVALSADPTLHLLGAFAIELATVWLALWTYCRLTDRRLTGHVDRRAVIGLGYAGAAVALPAPTLEVSYHFVFSVLAVGMVSAPAPRRGGKRLPITVDRTDAPGAVATGLAAVTLAAAVYAVAYLAL